MRILILLAIALLLYVIISNLLRKNRSSISEGKSERMVKCEQCGLHIPASEAISEHGQYFCSVEHLQAHHH